MIKKSAIERTALTHDIELIASESADGFLENITGHNKEKLLDDIDKDINLQAIKKYNGIAKKPVSSKSVKNFIEKIIFKTIQEIKTS